MKSIYSTIISVIFAYAIIGNPFLVEEASAQLDGVEGTVVMSSETVRAGITGDTPITYPVFTSYSEMFGQYYLADHRNDDNLHTYDATGYNEPGAAGSWFSVCTEPLCYAVNQSSNSWLTGDNAYHASDFRNARRVLDFFSWYYGRNGADNNGENLNILSGVNYNNATAMGVHRSIAIGKPDYAAGKPSFGTIGVMAHEFTHIMSWHEWVGIFDYGFEGSLHGVKGTVDEHLANLFGVISTYYLADEPWIKNIRWAYEAERNYGENYPHRNDADFYNTMNISRNPYLGTDSGEPRAYVSQIYFGSDDNGGINKNSVLLDRAAYLFTEGGYAAKAPNGVKLVDWPENAPDFEVKGIGINILMKIAYDIITTVSYATPVGTIGLADLQETEQDSAAMKAELTRYAYIFLAAAEKITKAYSLPSWVPVSVRNGFAAVGLLPADIDGYVVYDNTDSTILADVKVYLYNSERKIIDSALTNSLGYYKFSDVKNGKYMITAKSNSTVKEVNPIDALLVNRYFIKLYDITDSLKLFASDATCDFLNAPDHKIKINPIDALMINRKFIKTISNFKEDWHFETRDINVDGQSISINLRGICIGDVNASYK